MRRSVAFILIFSCLLLSGFHAGAKLPDRLNNKIRGIVYHDISGTGSYDPDQDSALAGVAVSNGREIVITGTDGSYELPVDDHTIVFLIKPRNWTVPVDENHVPLFYYIHSVHGATGRRYEGLQKTGAMPESADFALYPHKEPDRFDVLVLGDTQPRDLDEVYFFTRDMVAGLTGFDAAFGVTLGDIVFDDLDLFVPVQQSIATIGLPWRYVLGNHDIDHSAKTNMDARGAWYRTFGPSYYSFSWGPAHFILLDNIRWIVEDGKSFYRTGLGGEQMEFLRNELSRIGKDQLLVILTHIPWEGSTPWGDDAERNDLYELLAGFENSVSLVAHTHRHYHYFIGVEDGFPGTVPHHMVSVGTACGSWWTGAPDEYGIPHAMMSDGTPTSYAILHIDGNSWKLSLRASRRPADFQMHIHAPVEISVRESVGLTVTANIFNALPAADVQMRIGDSREWTKMHRIRQADPVRVAVAEREKKLGRVPWRNLGGVQVSEHLWEGQPGMELEPGAHIIHVRARDEWWEYEGRHIIFVR
jgi:hypothetical protein